MVKNYIVKRYEASDYARWNAFISTAKNATFLFYRDFMEYHSDRFEDYSLVILKGEEIVCVIPAQVKNNIVSSHLGLTYGGFVFAENVKLGETILMVQKVLHFLHNNEVEKLQLKIIPSIYNSIFSEEINYSLFLTDAKPIRRDCLSVIDLKAEVVFSRDRRRSVRQSFNNNLEVREEYNFGEFWEKLLIPNLEKTYNAKPVHSVEEIIALQKLFPENIRHFNVYQNDELIAGSTVFSTDRVAHPQYIAGNERRNETGSLDFLYNYLITEVYSNKHYFDFGPSHEDAGKKINSGILFWKESFGTKTVIQDFYEIETANHALLTNVLI